MNQLIGVCCFDDPVLGGSGWASIAGKEAERVDSHAGLRTDVVWITNLAYTAYRNLNLIKSPHIFDAQYFRTSVPKLMEELGLTQEQDLAAKILSEIFNRTAQLGFEQCKIDVNQVNYRYSNTLTSILLPDVARQRPTGSHSAELCEVFKQSTQENQAMSHNQRPSGSKGQAFGFPRNSYFRWLLSQPVPVGSKWDEVKQRNGRITLGFEDGKVIAGTPAVLEKLRKMGEGKALFFETVVENTDPLYATFAGFGSGVSYPRRWAALPEILELSRYARISLGNGFMTDAKPLPLPKGLLEGSAVSISQGLLLENVWAAVSASLYGGDFKTAVGAYYRAYDRMVCGSAAAELSKFSATVGSYSAGRVIVFVRPGEERVLSEKALSLGLCPPAHLMGATYHAS